MFRSIAALTMFMPAMALAQSLSGPARAVDGDSLTVGGLSVRLFGIDAPEGQQTCSREGQTWACGEEAKRKLQGLIGTERVSCNRKATDQYGRMVAVCSKGTSELNRAMVDLGWATAFRKYSDTYVAAEQQARERKLGIWSSSFVPPEQFRATHRPPEEARQAGPARVVRSMPQPVHSSSGCAIKGNRNRKGQWIYHLPGMPYYDATRAEEMFCSEAQAQAAGYRRAIVRR